MPRGRVARERLVDVDERAVRRAAQRARQARLRHRVLLERLLLAEGRGREGAGVRPADEGALVGGAVARRVEDLQRDAGAARAVEHRRRLRVEAEPDLVARRGLLLVLRSSTPEPAPAAFFDAGGLLPPAAAGAAVRRTGRAASSGASVRPRRS